MGKSLQKYLLQTFPIISFALLPSSRFNLHVYFRLFCQTPVIEMPSLIRKEKITCENCGTQTTRNTIVCSKKRCSVGTLYCTQCHNFSTKSQNDLSYHIAKKHSAPKLDVTFKCKLCFQQFPGFYALRQHRNTPYGMQIGSRTRYVDVEHIVGDVDDHRLREELRVPVNISWCIRNLKERDTKYSITQWKLSMKQSRMRNLIIFSAS